MQNTNFPLRGYVHCQLLNHSLLAQGFLGQQHLVVDGRPDALSATRFAAAAQEVLELGGQVNSAWLCPCAPSASASAAAASGWPAPGLGPAAEQQGADGALQFLLRQAALGHLLNHPPPHTTPSVTYDLCPLPGDLPGHLMRYAPSLNFVGRRAAARPGPPGAGTWRMVVVLRAVKDLHAGGVGNSSGLAGRQEDAEDCEEPVELFMDYGRDPLSLGYTP